MEEQEKNINDAAKQRPAGSDALPASTDQQTVSIVDANTKPMEVHHPHHPVHDKKKWKEYLSEFLMLFLAVFLGFLAENLREHISERHKEKEYMHSLVADLRSDVASFQANTALSRKRIKEIDTLISLLHSNDRNQHTNQIYFLARSTTINAGSYIPNTRTFTQLTNSGGLRLIHYPAAADSITDYYQAIKWIESENAFMAAFTEQYIQDDHLLFDNFIYQQIISKDSTDQFHMPYGNPALTSTSPEVINQVIARLHRLFSIKIIITNKINSKYIPQANRLIDLLEKVYEL